MLSKNYFFFYSTTTAVGESMQAKIRPHNSTIERVNFIVLKIDYYAQWRRNLCVLVTVAFMQSLFQRGARGMRHREWTCFESKRNFYSQWQKNLCVLATIACRQTSTKGYKSVLNVKEFLRSLTREFVLLKSELCKNRILCSHFQFCVTRVCGQSFYRGVQEVRGQTHTVFASDRPLLASYIRIDIYKNEIIRLNYEQRKPKDQKSDTRKVAPSTDKTGSLVKPV